MDLADLQYNHIIIQTTVYVFFNQDTMINFIQVKEL